MKLQRSKIRTTQRSENGKFKYAGVAEWQTRTTQNRVPSGVSVRPRPPVPYFSLS